jgi:predicted anti-sigma-YlaC factor YlaD
MNNNRLMPCTAWAERLAARHPEDISPTDRIALNDHIATCEACAAVYAAYGAMEINVRALPTTSLPGLPYDRLRRQEKFIMPSLSSLLAYFGLLSPGVSRTTAWLLPIRRPTSIKQSLFSHAIIAWLALILIVGVVELSVPPQHLASQFSAATSTPSAHAATPPLDNALSANFRHINSLFLSLYRRCPDYFSLPAPDVDLTQQSDSGNLACRALQDGR